MNTNKKQQESSIDNTSQQLDDISDNLQDEDGDAQNFFGDEEEEEEVNNEEEQEEDEDDEEQDEEDEEDEKDDDIYDENDQEKKQKDDFFNDDADEIDQTNIQENINDDINIEIDSLIDVKRKKKKMDVQIIEVKNKEQLIQHFGNDFISKYEIVKIMQQGKHLETSKKNIIIVREQEGRAQNKIFLIDFMLFSNIKEVFNDPVFDYRKINWKQDDIDDFRKINSCQVFIEKKHFMQQ